MEVKIGSREHPLANGTQTGFKIEKRLFTERTIAGEIRSIKSFQKNNRMAGNQVSLQWVDMPYIYALDAQKG